MKIMKHLWLFGPLEASIEPSTEFSLFRGNVFRDTPAEEKHHDTTAHPYIWTKTSHSVLLTGWGWDGDTPFWHIRNPWGPHWGHKGDGKILRGQETAHIESALVTANVALLEHGLLVT
eukprot:GHVT01000739.1.p1 GENE.GHVT01000739.1~~GHVT01000739.1.p1  ORF type:complete len:118 (+),score=14.15 GHVT01000739.1:635-988(+)